MVASGRWTWCGVAVLSFLLSSRSIWSGFLVAAVKEAARSIGDATQTTTGHADHQNQEHGRNQNTRKCSGASSIGADYSSGTGSSAGSASACAENDRTDQKKIFGIGEPVWYFHREFRSSHKQAGFAAVLDRSHGIYRPRIGLTEGYLPGRITAIDYYMSSLTPPSNISKTSISIKAKVTSLGSSLRKMFAERAAGREMTQQESHQTSVLDETPLNGDINDNNIIERARVQLGPHFGPEHLVYTVRSEWPHFADARGIFFGGHDRNLQIFRNVTSNGLVFRRVGQDESSAMPPNMVRGSDYTGGSDHDHFRPKLSILAFRWGGREVPATKESEFLATSPTFMYHLQDLALQPMLGNDYEVWSIWVSSPDECVILSKSLHLIFGKNHPARRAERIAAFYFLHPSSFDFGSEPLYQTGSANGAGYIEQSPFYDMMRASERLGIYSAFPHQSALYHQLTAKTWSSQLSLEPRYSIPPTVSLPRVFVTQDPQSAAERAIRALEHIKRVQSKRRMEEQATNETPIFLHSENVVKGVAKLGYSWEALDVKLWQNTNSLLHNQQQLDGTTTSEPREREGKNTKHNYPLSAALRDLSDTINISNELVGQAHRLDWIMVQEFVPHALEMRLYYIKGKLKQVWYTRFNSVKSNNEFGEFYYMSESVALSYMRGDVKALREATKKGQLLAESLLDWLVTQTGELTIPAIRFDLFVQYLPDATPTKPWTEYEEKWDSSLSGRTAIDESRPQAGQVRISLLEICEAGFSIFGSESLKREKLKAIVESALENGRN
ncbi:unnamed protein product [Amoebophrya sp. A25]|nr:unnamed protein product [Amoebophrya sp. A25]|eukprot:GSA25T00011868001.1